MIYGANGKATAVILPLTAERFQVLTDAEAISPYEAKVKELQVPHAEAAAGGLGSGSLSQGHSAGGIKVGMTKEQVKKKLGEPDSTGTIEDHDVWYVTKLNVASDAVSEGVDTAAAFLPFGGLFASSAGGKITPKKTSYVIYFLNDTVTNVKITKG